MVGIRTPGAVPSGGLYGAPGIVQNLLRGAPRASIFPDRLLGKDRKDSVFCALYSPQGLNVAGRRQAQTVAEAEGGGKAEGGQHRAPF